MRYTGSAIGYNLASILGAALAPIIAVTLWQAAPGAAAQSRNSARNRRVVKTSPMAIITT